MKINMREWERALFMVIIGCGALAVLIHLLLNTHNFGGAGFMLGIILLAVIIVAGMTTGFYLLGSEGEIYYEIELLKTNTEESKVTVKGYRNAAAVTIVDRIWLFPHKHKEIAEMETMPVYMAYNRHKELIGANPVPYNTL